MDALVDNDILKKGACYGLLNELFNNGPVQIKDFGVLGAARFVVIKAIQKCTLNGNPDCAVERLNEFLAGCIVVEPTDAEQTLAADLELQAQKMGVPLDVGESQLCAVLIVRALQLLLTGDKRAIQAMQELLPHIPNLQSICGKIVCLEQLILNLISAENFDEIQASICSEPDIDKALSISFSCKSGNASLDSALEGLNSYINDLRRNATQILMN